MHLSDGTGTPVGDIDGGKASPNESGGKAKEDEDLDNVDFMKMMKKKKKKQAFNLDELGGGFFALFLLLRYGRKQ